MDFRRETLCDHLNSRRRQPESDSYRAFPVRENEYEVFLSFHESNTLKTFTDYLYNDFTEAGVRTFRHSLLLLPGHDLEAMRQSKVSVVVFSKDYASSIRCLTELGQLVECSNSKIIPVFLDLTPSEVRCQIGHYQEAFRNHQMEYDEECVRNWRETLKTVGSLKGLDLESANKYQGKLAKDVVSKVFKELKRQYLDVPENLVGIDKHVDAILKLVDIENEDKVRIVGIWGMGGIGKTTVAKLVYNQLIQKFDNCSFLQVDVGETSESKRLESLQRKLISDLTRYNHDDISTVDSGKYMLKDRFLDKKVLILLDDVAHAELLKDLIPNVQSFGQGSRIIITTRDKSVLDEWKVELIYRVVEMCADDAFLLFCKYAFRQDNPMTEFANLSWEVSKTAGGLPLAIKAIGSYLSYNLREDIWVEKLGGLRIEPMVRESLLVSFDSLDQETKEIFLDIACLFNGMDSRILVHMWKACKLLPVRPIKDLIRKSLILVGDDSKIHMHVQLRHLGRDIVHAETHIHGHRSRLLYEDGGLEVLENEEGTGRVKAISLDNNGEELRGTLVSGSMFQELSNLEFLGLGFASLDGQFKGRLLRLKWLSWHGDTELNLPLDLNLKSLVVVDLSESSIGEDWRGWRLLDKVAKKLEVINLSRCDQLRTTPDFTNSFPSLKRLILEECGGLEEVHPSVGQLKVLECLSLKDCWEVKTLPKELGSLEALTELVVDGTGIREIPISDGMRNLETLSCKFCKSLRQLPESCEFLVKLRRLFLDHCESLRKIPASMLEQLVCLEELSLSYTGVEVLPDCGGNSLKVVNISCSQITSVPWSLQKLKNLQVLNNSNEKGEIFPLGLATPSSISISLSSLLEEEEEEEEDVTRRRIPNMSAAVIRETNRSTVVHAEVITV